MAVVGKKFKSFEDIQTFMEILESKDKQKYWIRDSKTIQAVKLKQLLIRPELKYYSIKYTCIHGGEKLRSRAKGVRKSSTLRMDCPAHILFGVSDDGNQLQIKSSNLNHIGHDLTKDAYDHLPQVKRWHKSDKERDNLQNKNLSSFMNDIFSSDELNTDLKNTIKLLTEDYEANVSVLEDDCDNFKALCFSTAQMRNSFATWPEIVVIDSTYKLLNANSTVVLLLIIDSEGNSEICGVAVVRNEDYTTFKWFLDVFKGENEEAVTRIKCFMGEKDLLWSIAIKEVFPGAPFYICMFHTLNAFKRNISNDKMQISIEQKNIALQILNKLVYSTSAKQYDTYYNAFCDAVQNIILDYFNEQWHAIKEQWVSCFMLNGNLKNFINNRIESIISKIKNTIPKYSTLENFFKSFFQWLHLYNLKKGRNIARLILKRPSENLSVNSCKFLYRNYLTNIAFSYVLQQMQLSQIITIIQITTDPNTSIKTFTVKSSTGPLDVSTTHCECEGFSSMLLPCHHILSIRKLEGLSLYEESMCHPRWRRSTIFKNYEQFATTEIDNTTDELPLEIHVVKDEISLNIEEKQNTVKFVLESLTHLMTQSVDSNFYDKLFVLQEVEAAWRYGNEVEIKVLDNDISGSHQFAIVNLQSSVCNDEQALLNTNSVPNGNDTIPNRDETQGFEPTCAQLTIGEEDIITEDNVQSLGVCQTVTSPTHITETSDVIHDSTTKINIPMIRKTMIRCSNTEKIDTGKAKRRKTIIPRKLSRRKLKKKFHFPVGSILKP